MTWEILDCTLRDGGYYTNWDFDHEIVDQYLGALDKLHVRYCELGYRSPVKEGYFGEYFYLRASTLARIRETAKYNFEFSLMLNAKDCEPSGIRSLLAGCSEFIGMIRLAVDPDKLQHGLSIARAVKECGYTVAINLMYLHKFNIDRQRSLFDELTYHNGVIDYLYFVDSFGSCFPSEVASVVANAKSKLKCKIGFHGHDNIELAFANSLAAIEAGADIIDSTMLGLGRGAGNLRTELATAYASKQQGQQQDIFQLTRFLQVWKEFIRPFTADNDYPYIVSGLEKLPQGNVMGWMSQNRYGINLIVQALREKRVDVANKANFTHFSRDVRELNAIKGNSTIAIGGGPSVLDHCAAIKSVAINTQAIVIHASLKHVKLLSDKEINQIVCLSGDEALKIDFVADLYLKNILAFVVPSPPSFGAVPQELLALNVPVYCTDPVSISDDPLQRDTPIGLALSIANELGFNVMLAGFDGYRDHGNKAAQIMTAEAEEILQLNQNRYPETGIQSITPTHYAVAKTSVYAI
jgi:4-hydroxy 2-oxovalerate aldolase